MEKKLAAQRVIGRDHAGREVLVAAPGQPIDERRFAVDGSPKTTSAEAEASPAVNAEVAAASHEDKAAGRSSRKGK